MEEEKTKHCVIHPDRVARVDAAGILVCTMCFEVYRLERRAFQDFNDRVFYQRLIQASAECVR